MGDTRGIEEENDTIIKLKQFLEAKGKDGSGKRTSPLLYKAITPLSRVAHRDLRISGRYDVRHLEAFHALPVTISEFTQAQLYHPIVFSSGDESVPVALFGLHPGTNLYFDENGFPLDPDGYEVAYLRRYPFLLAKPEPGSDDLFLCADLSSNLLSETEGEPMFDEDGMTELLCRIQNFCEFFEEEGHRTKDFISNLKSKDLLVNGEITIQANSDEPAVYRGFQMIDRDCLDALDDVELGELHKSGHLEAIYAHLASLEHVKTLFKRQVRQGKGPVPHSGA